MTPTGNVIPLSIYGKRGGQASSEDLLPLGYGERERDRVRVTKPAERFTIGLNLVDFPAKEK
jgi:hypothetical protein